MSAARRFFSRSLAASLALALAPTFGGELVEASSAGELELSLDVEFVLFDLGGGGPIEVGPLFDALRTMGVGATHDVLDALGSAYVPGTDGRPRKLERRRRDELTEALIGVPAHVLRLELGGELEREARTPAVEIALAIVGALGREDQLSTAFALAETATSERLERRVARALEGCLVELLVRHPEAHQRLGMRFRDVQPVLRWTVVRAVGEARQREGFGFFAQIIGQHPELDASVLIEVGRLAATHRPPHDWSLQMRLRSYLGSTQAALRREAAGTMARLEDRESFEAIVGLLSDSDRGVRDNALWAARALSGKGFGPEPMLWQQWYEEQATWWSERAPEILARISGGRGSERLQGMGELASRTLFRHDLARELSALLVRRDDHALLRSVCGALGDLGSPVALPALIGLLEHGERPVREQAWKALRRITAEDLPPEPSCWVGLLP